MSSKKYVDEKTKYAYSLVQQGRLFEKVRSIVYNDQNQIFIIENKGNGVFTLPGGGVDEGETIEEAAKRELFEETGIVGEPVLLLGEKFYDVPMQYKGEDFVSKRVEKFYLCKFVSREDGVAGLKGEYTDKMSMRWDDPSVLEKTFTPKEVVDALKAQLEKIEK